MEWERRNGVRVEDVVSVERGENGIWGGVREREGVRGIGSVGLGWSE